MKRFKRPPQRWAGSIALTILYLFSLLVLLLLLRDCGEQVGFSQ